MKSQHQLPVPYLVNWMSFNTRLASLLLLRGGCGGPPILSCVLLLPRTFICAGQILLS